MGRIFHEPQSVFPSKGPYCLHVDHHAGDVYGNDPRDAERRVERRAACDQIADFPGSVGQIDVQRQRIAIDQKRYCALVADDLGRGGESHRGNQHGLARLQPQCLDR